ncbi:MAG TPA: hypothetical protein PLD01_16025 [Mycobacterium sp.]|nr:hypothetical protein [Mycobacterium sp.]
MAQNPAAVSAVTTEATGTARGGGQCARGPGTACAATATVTPHREQARVAAVAALTADPVQSRRETTSASVTAVAQQQASVATLAAGASGHTGSTIAAVADYPSVSAVAAVEAVAAAADQPAVSTCARIGAGAGDRGPAVAVAEDQARVRILGGAVADEDPDEVRDRIAG